MLLDTSGLLCLHFKTEPLHTQACTEYKKSIIRVTHNYIISEYVALANARRFPRQFVLDFVVDLLDNPDIETVWVDEQLHRAAVKLNRRSLFDDLDDGAIAYKANCVSKYHLMGIKRSRGYRKATKRLCIVAKVRI